MAGGGGDNELDLDSSAVAMETVSLSPPVVLFPTMASTALSSLSLSVKSGHSAEKQKQCFRHLDLLAPCYVKVPVPIKVTVKV